jgi:hypothetical protein
MAGITASQFGHLTIFPIFSVAGLAARAASSAGAPQEVQNFALSPIFFPQFVQKAISLFSFIYEAAVLPFGLFLSYFF